MLLSQISKKHLGEQLLRSGHKAKTVKQNQVSNEKQGIWKKHEDARHSSLTAHIQITALSRFHEFCLK